MFSSKLNLRSIKNALKCASSLILETAEVLYPVIDFAACAKEAVVKVVRTGLRELMKENVRLTHKLLILRAHGRPALRVQAIAHSLLQQIFK